MSFDSMLRQMVREEVTRALAPLQALVLNLKAQTAATAKLAASLGGVKRGPGRPPLLGPGGKRGPGRPVGSTGRRGRPAAAERLCAVIGCTNPARSKGYCANHYQKLRNLQKTDRLPPDWKENAAPQTVKNVELPRGRAASVK